MRAFILAILAMAVISVGAWYGLNMLGYGGDTIVSADARL